MKCAKMLSLHKSSSDFYGYPDGEAITESDLLRRAEQSNNSIKEGHTKQIDQLRKEVKGW